MHIQLIVGTFAAERKVKRARLRRGRLFLLKCRSMTKEDISKAVAGYLSSHNLFLVDITISKDDDIEITIESRDADVKIDNCIDIDHIVSETFDRDVHDYSLTVTSAGLDQPFKVLEQYEKFKGEEVELVAKQLSAESEGIKRGAGGKIAGVISSVAENGIELSVAERVKEPGAKKRTEVTRSVFFAFENIKSCKPVIKFK